MKFKKGDEVSGEFEGEKFSGVYHGELTKGFDEGGYDYCIKEEPHSIIVCEKQPILVVPTRCILKKIE